jgi:hypothetical protein
MPEFPGIAKAEKTENWDAGFALDMKRIRPKDEQYWKDHRGTPKAFVALKTGESLWGSRFGADTAVRFPAGVSEAAAQAAILGRIDPAQLGLAFLPVRELGVAAVAQAEDFGGLFLGFSFFLMAAAVVLTGLMFRFGLDQRMEEAGTLLALGWTAGRARRLFLAEAALVAALGGAVGALGGTAYAAGILRARFWAADWRRCSSALASSGWACARRPRGRFASFWINRTLPRCRVPPAVGLPGRGRRAPWRRWRWPQRLLPEAARRMRARFSARALFF